MKSFTDLLTEEVKLVWPALTDSKLVSYISHGFPVALAAYLQKTLEDSDNNESELTISLPDGDLVKFTLKGVKKGDSVAFLPEFELCSYGKELINKDSIGFDIETDLDKAMHEMSKNKLFCEYLDKAFRDCVYVKGEWESNNKGDTNVGLEFVNREDVAAAAIMVVVKLLSILCDNKDEASTVEYKYDTFATFKISATKNGYDVTATFDKEFKSNCKCDELAEKIAEVEE